MKPNQLAILGGVAVAALGAGLLLNAPGNGGGNSGDGIGQLLVPGLDAAINDVTALTIRAGQDTLTLRRSDGGWTVAEKADYPASMEKVRGLLVGLAGARLLEAKTSNPDNYATLGVAPPQDGGLEVELGTADGLLDGGAIVVGNSARAGSATYVRRTGEDRSWLVSGNLSVETEASEWLDTLVTNIAGQRIQSVRIEHEDGEQVVIAKDNKASAEYTVEAIPDGRNLRYASIANPIGSALANLRFEDVLPRTALDDSFEAVSTVRFNAFDGLVVTIRSYLRDGDRFITLAGATDPALAARFADPADTGDTTAGDIADDAVASGEGGDATPVADGNAAVDEAVADQAERLNSSHEDWLYGIGSYKFDQLTRRMEDLLEVPAQSDEGE
jgi:hypothetical protein